MWSRGRSSSVTKNQELMQQKIKPNFVQNWYKDTVQKKPSFSFYIAKKPPEFPLWHFKAPAQPPCLGLPGLSQHLPELCQVRLSCRAARHSTCPPRLCTAAWELPKSNLGIYSSPALTVGSQGEKGPFSSHLSASTTHQLCWSTPAPCPEMLLWCRSEQVTGQDVVTKKPFCSGVPPKCTLGIVWAKSLLP